MRSLHMAGRRRALPPAVTFRPVALPVPPSRVVRIPDGYAHEFASVPNRWHTLTDVPMTTKVVVVPMLDPASDRELRRAGL